MPVIRTGIASQGLSIGGAPSTGQSTAAVQGKISLIKAKAGLANARIGSQQSITEGSAAAARGVAARANTAVGIAQQGQNLVQQASINAQGVQAETQAAAAQSGALNNAGAALSRAGGQVSNTALRWQEREQQKERFHVNQALDRFKADVDDDLVGVFSKYDPETQNLTAQVTDAIGELGEEFQAKIHQIGGGRYDNEIASRLETWLLQKQAETAAVEVEATNNMYVRKVNEGLDRAKESTYKNPNGWKAFRDAEFARIDSTPLPPAVKRQKKKEVMNQLAAAYGLKKSEDDPYTFKEEAGLASRFQGLRGDGPMVNQPIKWRTGTDPNVVEESLAKFSQFQDIWGKSFTITSGFRTAARNKEVGGEPGSAHTPGGGATGIDFSIAGESTEDKKQMIALLSALGFKGIGIYDSHIHVDLKEKPGVKARAWGPDHTKNSIPDEYLEVMQGHISGNINAINAVDGDPILGKRANELLDSLDFAQVISLEAKANQSIERQRAQAQAQLVADQNNALGVYNLRREQGDNPLPSEIENNPLLTPNQIATQLKASADFTRAQGKAAKLANDARIEDTMDDFKLNVELGMTTDYEDALSLPVPKGEKLEAIKAVYDWRKDNLGEEAGAHGALKGNYDFRIALAKANGGTGMPTVDEVANDERLNEGTRADLIDTLNSWAGSDKNKYKYEPSRAVNPFNNDDITDVNNMYDAFQNGVGDIAQTVAAIRSPGGTVVDVPTGPVNLTQDQRDAGDALFVSRTGALAQPQVAALELGLKSADPQAYQNAIAKAELYNQLAPNYFDAKPNKIVEDALVLNRALVGRGTMSIQEAATIASRHNQPDFEEKRDLLQKKLTTKIKGVLGSSSPMDDAIKALPKKIDTEYDTISTILRLGPTDTQRLQMNRDYSVFYEHGYLMANGDVDEAHNIAMELLGNVYGVSDVGGQTTFQRLPPEKMFPLVAAEDIQNIVKDNIRGYLNSIDGDADWDGNFWLIPTTDTWNNKKQGQDPDYIVLYDDNGTVKEVPDSRFTITQDTMRALKENDTEQNRLRTQLARVNRMISDSTDDYSSRDVVMNNPLWDTYKDLQRALKLTQDRRALLAGGNSAVNRVLQRAAGGAIDNAIDQWNTVDGMPVAPTSALDKDRTGRFDLGGRRRGAVPGPVVTAPTSPSAQGVTPAPQTPTPDDFDNQAGLLATSDDTDTLPVAAPVAEPDDFDSRGGILSTPDNTDDIDVPQTTPPGPTVPQILKDYDFYNTLGVFGAEEVGDVAGLVSPAMDPAVTDPNPEARTAETGEPVVTDPNPETRFEPAERGWKIEEQNIIPLIETDEPDFFDQFGGRMPERFKGGDVFDADEEAGILPMQEQTIMPLINTKPRVAQKEARVASAVAAASEDIRPTDTGTTDEGFPSTRRRTKFRYDTKKALSLIRSYVRNATKRIDKQTKNAGDMTTEDLEALYMTRQALLKISRMDDEELTRSYNKVWHRKLADRIATAIKNDPSLAKRRSRLMNPIQVMETLGMRDDGHSSYGSSNLIYESMKDVHMSETYLNWRKQLMKQYEDVR